MGIARPSRGTITVHVPIRFRQIGGRKTLIAPPGTNLTAPTRPTVNQALAKAVARAFRWRRMLETGVHATIHEIAATEKVNASYVSRVLRLALLAPDIIEAILDGRSAGLRMEQLLRPFPADWEKQRQSQPESSRK